MPIVLAVIILFCSWVVLPALIQLSPFLKILTPFFEIVGTFLAVAVGLIMLIERRAGESSRTARRSNWAFQQNDEGDRNDNPNYHPSHNRNNNRDYDRNYGAENISRPTEWTVSLLRDLEWKRFEDLCNEYHRECGIRSKTTGLGADGGVDIRIYDRNTGVLIAVTQCKAWPTTPIGVDQVRQLRGTMAHERVRAGTFITNGAYTQPALDLARLDGIILVDGEGFVNLIKQLSAESQARLLDFATRGDYTTPTCPHCGIKMIRRAGRKTGRKFWGCRNYPSCKEKQWMRKGSH